MLKKILSLFFVLSFLITFIITPAQAQVLSGNDLVLPKPGSMVDLSKAFKPAILRGIKVNAQNPLKFDFILDPGDALKGTVPLKQESTQLIKYFLTTLTIPDNDIWVNLSPYEKDRIITEKFGQTEMGRNLLAQDYLLKQITASLMFPRGEIGKKFWNRIYKEAQKKFGSTAIPVNTFNKVWIMPDKAVIYEKMGENQATAFVIESSLKVMLEEDYLALKKHTVILSGAKDLKAHKDSLASPQNDNFSKQIIREVMIPILEKEVNEDANFFPLRQIYNSILLALWYKQRMQGSILQSAYVNHSKIAGVDVKDKKAAQKIWQRYVQAYKKGVFNFIKEEPVDIASASSGIQTMSFPNASIGDPEHATVARKYFAGGFNIGNLKPTVTNRLSRRLKLWLGALATSLFLVTAGCNAGVVPLEKPSVPSIPDPFPPLAPTFLFPQMDIVGNNPNAGPNATWNRYHVIGFEKSSNTSSTSSFLEIIAGPRAVPNYIIDSNPPIGMGGGPGVSVYPILWTNYDTVYGEKVLLTNIELLHNISYLYYLSGNAQPTLPPDVLNQAINTIEDGLPHFVDAHLDIDHPPAKGYFVTIEGGTDLYVFDTTATLPPQGGGGVAETSIGYDVNLFTGQVHIFHSKTPIILDTTSTSTSTGLGLGSFPEQVPPGSQQTTLDNIRTKYFTSPFPYAHVSAKQADKLAAIGKRLKWLSDMAMVAKKHRQEPNVTRRAFIAGMAAAFWAAGCNAGVVPLQKPPVSVSDAGENIIFDFLPMMGTQGISVSKAYPNGDKWLQEVAVSNGILTVKDTSTTNGIKSGFTYNIYPNGTIEEINAATGSVATFEYEAPGWQDELSKVIEVLNGFVNDMNWANYKDRIEPIIVLLKAALPPSSDGGISPDRAMNARNGGIDLTKNATPLDVRHSGQAVHFHIDPAQIAAINAAPGLSPQVFSIKRLKSLSEFLALPLQDLPVWD